MLSFLQPLFQPSFIFQAAFKCEHASQYSPFLTAGGRNDVKESETWAKQNDMKIKKIMHDISSVRAESASLVPLLDTFMEKLDRLEDKQNRSRKVAWYTPNCSLICYRFLGGDSSLE